MTMYEVKLRAIASTELVIPADVANDEEAARIAKKAACHTDNGAWDLRFVDSSTIEVTDVAED